MLTIGGDTIICSTTFITVLIVIRILTIPALISEG